MEKMGAMQAGGQFVSDSGVAIVSDTRNRITMCGCSRARTKRRGERVAKTQQCGDFKRFVGSCLITRDPSAIVERVDREEDKGEGGVHGLRREAYYDRGCIM